MKENFLNCLYKESPLEQESCIKEIDRSCSIIIRSVGERTADQCYKTLLNFGFKDIVVVDNVIPFTQALKKSLEEGIKADKKWTLVFDADVIVSKIGLILLMKFAETLPRVVFEIQTLVLDKFIGVYREAGNHLYRTEYIANALELIPQEFSAIRPESRMINRMHELGFKKEVNLSLVIGVHDFEQSYVDIYRKAYIYAQKHLKRSSMFLSFWRDNCQKDNDFLVALKAFSDGITYTGPVSINKNQQLDAAEVALKYLGLKEKGPLDDQINADQIIQEDNSGLMVKEFSEITDMTKYLLYDEVPFEVKLMYKLSKMPIRQRLSFELKRLLNKL